jgi:hypothetical protein
MRSLAWRLGVLAVPVLLALSPPQDDIELKWSLPPDSAAEYIVYDTSKGRPILSKDRAFVVFPADANGGFLINTYDDLPWHFVLTLPTGKQKVGASWPVEKDLFEEGRAAVAPIIAFKPVAVRGVCTLKKLEKVGEADCARVDATYRLHEIKIDEKNNKRTVSKSEYARFTTIAWYRLADGVLAKGAVDFDGKADDFRGVKQGNLPRSVKKSTGELVELKAVVKADQLAHTDGIGAAIKKGVEALRKMQRKDGSWQDDDGFARDNAAGMTGLCLMALLHSGVRADDPQVRAGFGYMLSQPLKRTYDVACGIMAVETKYLPLEKYEDVQALTEPAAREAVAKAIAKEDLAWVQKAAAWLVEHQTKDGTWGYPENDDSRDHSNTQYAMLALKSASRCGVAIRADVWKKAANHWIAAQRVVSPQVGLRITWLSDDEKGVDTRAEERVTQGPWGYFTAAPKTELITDGGYGSMTCAGLTSLVVAESELVHLKELDDALRKKIDGAKKQGLAWLQEHFTVRGNPPSAGLWSFFYSYYLYGLERVGVLYGIKKIGDHDWYQEGALVLVPQQREDGSWSLYVDIPVLDTAFALLFLKKATVRVATRDNKRR